ncbi:hypothetical protein CLOM_g3347 [Closterium sp. NIES-68]|nr:hypothetical protein CLOM_g3347 [Closterium sp. NIES-68]GJP67058.1 hypothetical protein CLOP_g23930 [Closterium sp. NIES-67]GJP81631.1 hypothetical protein CLOP_g11787 [Closterium sp. NIES-67]
MTWRSAPCIMGIDEAGRGPVLGPMVYACAYCAASSKEQVARMGFADSKTLTEARREQLFRAMGGAAATAAAAAEPRGDAGSSDGVGNGNGNLNGNPNGTGNSSSVEDVGAGSRDGRERTAAGATEMASADVIGWEVDVISAAALSAQMLSRERTSLNAIAFESTAKLIQRLLDQRVNVVEAYVDTLGDPQKHQDRLSQRFPSVRFTVAKKADSLFPIVSAASIAAKVTRDRCIQSWRFREDAHALPLSTSTVAAQAQRLSQPSQHTSHLSQPGGGLHVAQAQSASEDCASGEEEEAATPASAAAAEAGVATGEAAVVSAGESFSLKLGSGYPADPDTKAWLAGSTDPVFGFPSLVRFSWATAKTIVDSTCVPVHWEGDEAEEEGQAWSVKQSSPVNSPTGSSPGPSKRKRKNVHFESVAQQRHSFFRARKLQLVTTKL